MADATYFGEPNYTDGINNYCVRHTTCTSRLIEGVSQPLTRPDFDTEEELDLTKASLAQQLLVMYAVSEPPMQPGPTKIIYAVDVEPFQTLAALNLTRIEIEA